MAKKKFGFGKVLLVGAAFAAAGGVVAYLKKAEIKQITEEVLAKIRTAREDDEYEDEFDDETPDIVVAKSADGAAEKDEGSSAPGVMDSSIKIEIDTPDEEEKKDE